MTQYDDGSNTTDSLEQLMRQYDDGSNTTDSLEQLTRQYDAGSNTQQTPSIFETAITSWIGEQRTSRS